MNKDNLTESIDYENYKINIYQDTHYNCQIDTADPDLFLTAYHRSFEVNPKELITKAECMAIATGDYEGDDDLKTRCQEIKKQYHYFGLKAYIHSGVRLALSYEGNFVDRRWDVSQLGMVFASKKEFKTREDAKKAALGLIETWNDDLSGNIYGYMIENKVGEEFGGCWGFYGDYQKSGLIKSAKAEVRDDIITVKAEEKAKIDNYNNLLALFAGQKNELTAYLDKYFTDEKFKLDIIRNFISIKAIITKKI